MLINAQTKRTVNAVLLLHVHCLRGMMTPDIFLVGYVLLFFTLWLSKVMVGTDNSVYFCDVHIRFTPNINRVYLLVCDYEEILKNSNLSNSHFFV